MNDFLDIYTIVFLALAVFVIFRLRSVLGQRTGAERPPFDPFQRPDPQASKPPVNASNVVSLPTANRDQKADDALLLKERLENITTPDSPLGLSLQQLMAADRGFDPKIFISGARGAYEMIVLAFARGDRKTLKDLLDKNVYENFVSAIDAREKRGEKVESTLVSLDKVEILNASLVGKMMNITVKFVSKFITATRDSSGAVIDGSPDTISDLVDVWTFAREAGTSDPNWRLVTTEVGS